MVTSPDHSPGDSARYLPFRHTVNVLDNWPVWALFAFFFAGAFLRGGFTYALGFGVRRVDQARTGWLSGDRVARAEQIVSRWGAPAVSLAFLTVGVQSAILAAAGVLRMPLRRFLPALAVGAAIWATVYTTIGMAVISAFWGQPTTRWVVGAALGIVLTWALTAWSRRRLEGRANLPGAQLPRTAVEPVEAGGFEKGGRSAAEHQHEADHGR